MWYSRTPEKPVPKLVASRMAKVPMYPTNGSREDELGSAKTCMERNPLPS
jgi:hypothetical protein